MAILNYLTTTHFDFGSVAQIPAEMTRLGIKRPLVVTDAGVRAAGLLDRTLHAVSDRNSLPVYDGTPANPTEAAVLQALGMFQAEHCDGIIAVGGGSAMDLGKAVALLSKNEGPLARFDPAKGGGKLIKSVAPLIAVPTTSGTGSEVSVGFVVILESGQKATFASPKLIPAVAICDPDLTLGLPPILTAGTGMDAITHCIEAVLSPVVNPPAEGVGLDGLWRGWRALRRAVENGSDRDARWNMMMASTEGAMAFVKGLGAVHSMSHAAGRIPSLRLHHGTLNAILLPTVLRFNEAAVPEKLERIAAAMGISRSTDVAEAVRAFTAELGLPPNLSALGIERSMIPDLVRFATMDLATRTNPRPMTARDYEQMFLDAM